MINLVDHRVGAPNLVCPLLSATKKIVLSIIKTDQHSSNS